LNVELNFQVTFGNERGVLCFDPRSH